MTEFTDMVKKNLEENGADEKTLDLWESISREYIENGPDSVNEFIIRLSKNIKNVANKQIRETKEAMSKKKGRK